MSLAERWAAMDEARLREELMSFFRAQGVMQSQLYEQITNLERRIAEQRKQINRLTEERHDLAQRAVHFEAALREIEGIPKEDFIMQGPRLPAAVARRALAEA